MLNFYKLRWLILASLITITTACGSGGSAECRFTECRDLDSEIGTIQYAVYQPESVTDNAPLLILFPGRFGTINSVNTRFAAQQFADEHAYILAMAQSPTLYWPYTIEGMDAVISLLDQVQADYPVNDQVFLAGFSNGAVLSNLVACGHSERLTGIFADAGPLPDNAGLFDYCTSSQSVAVAMLHGSQDELVHLDGGITWAGVTYPTSPVRDSFDYWRSFNACNDELINEQHSELEVSRSASTDYAQGCNAPVQFTISEGGRHQPNWQGEPLHNLMQQFFQAAILAKSQ